MGRGEGGCHHISKEEGNTDDPPQLLHLNPAISSDDEPVLCTVSPGFGELLHTAAEPIFMKAQLLSKQP